MSYFFHQLRFLPHVVQKIIQKKYTVTFYDGETVLKEEKVKENEKVARFEQRLVTIIFLILIQKLKKIHRFMQDFLNLKRIRENLTLLEVEEAHY